MISIIVRTCNRPRFLVEAMQSIAAQSYRPLEVVLVNDGGRSPDLDAIRKILADVTLHYREFAVTQGRPTAANEGLRTATGEFIGFLDDDDLLLPNHVALLHETAEKQQAEVVYSSVQAVHYDAEGQRLAEGPLYDADFSASRLLFENYIPLNALLFSRAALGDETFDEQLDFNEDWDLLIRLSRKASFYHISKVTAEYRLFPKNEERGEVHGRWFTKVFDKHRQLITGKDWQAFYQDYLIPQHDRDQDFLKQLLRSEQDRLEKLLSEYQAANQKISLEYQQLNIAHDLLNCQFQQLTNTHEQLQTEHQQLNITHDLLQTEHQQLNIAHDILKTEHQQLTVTHQHLAQELEIVYNSRSWWLTKPLRQMSQAVRYGRLVWRYALHNPPAVVARRALQEFYRTSLAGIILGWMPPAVKQRLKAWLLAGQTPAGELIISLKEPLVSILIPVYNHAKYLPQCLESALAQDYEKLEVIAVDDASPDPEVKLILQKFADQPRLT
ncbi:MAG: hypothetical protein DRH04_06460, partial [Deltaproteobacteria bacterium]